MTVATPDTFASLLGPGRGVLHARPALAGADALLSGDPRDGEPEAARLCALAAAGELAAPLRAVSQLKGRVPAEDTGFPDGAASPLARRVFDAAADALAAHSRELWEPLRTDLHALLTPTGMPAQVDRSATFVAGLHRRAGRRLASYLTESGCDELDAGAPVGTVLVSDNVFLDELLYQAAAAMCDNDPMVALRAFIGPDAEARLRAASPATAPDSEDLLVGRTIGDWLVLLDVMFAGVTHDGPLPDAGALADRAVEGFHDLIPF